MLALLRTFSWQELRHHPWRNATAVLAVMLGVALAFAVHLINASALSEFSSAVRSAGGEPDLELRPSQGLLNEAVFARVAALPGVAVASPVLELTTFATSSGGQRMLLRIVGIDALSAASVSPALLPVLTAGLDRFTLFAPGQVFLNPAARQAFGAASALQVEADSRASDVQVAGTVAAGGSALAVMDIAAAQDLFAPQGRISRIDVRLAPGVTQEDFLKSAALPANVVATQPRDAAQRVDNLSRAYRVNLTVLALVALFTGAFLVYSVLALSVARRSQQFALLGVLGLTASERLRLVMTESLVLGVLGSAAGIALGTALAEAGLARLGGDLGGGYFPGVAPRLHWSAGAALAYGALGVAAALAGGWLPARAAQRLPLAPTLKGVGTGPGGVSHHRLSVATIAAGGLFALLPPIGGIPLGAYVSVALMLVGGITALPWAVSLLYDRIAPAVARRVLPLLAVERARRVRESAAVAVSGVVASLSLAVALTVMVASFRDSVAHWLDVVLPADLYVRTASGSGSSDAAAFSADFVQAVSRVPGVQRVTTQRVRPLLLDPSRPSVALLARSIGDANRTLPLVGEARDAPAGQVPVYVSEAMVDLYGAKPGTVFAALGGAFDGRATFFVAGVWRDYVRQFGSVVVEREAYEKLTGDARSNDLQIFLAPGADAGDVQHAIRALAARDPGLANAIEFSSAQELRATSLRIFDLSYAVTYWLQAVAIGIGLFGIAASFSAQVLARRKEFGLLAHLGLTRGQILALVACEGAVWTAIGSIAGLVLGLAVAVVLVHVVNPQSFHWTMDLLVPWLRLISLCIAVVAAGTFTAWLAGRAAATRDAVLAVKEDW
jgi:putative ABC transport system permease protein